MSHSIRDGAGRHACNTRRSAAPPDVTGVGDKLSRCLSSKPQLIVRRTVAQRQGKSDNALHSCDFPLFTQVVQGSHLSGSPISIASRWSPRLARPP